MKFTKGPIFIVIIAVIAGLSMASYSLFGETSNRGIETKQINEWVVQKMQLTEEVSSTGRVTAGQNVELAFERGGKVAAINAAVGDTVHAGRPIVILEHADFTAQLLQAKAVVKTQQANLDALKRGARPEDIQVQEVHVENARTSLNEARGTLLDTLRSTYTVADDAVHNKSDQMFTNPHTNLPHLIPWFIDQALVNDVEDRRISIGRDIFRIWSASLAEITIESDLLAYANSTADNLGSIELFLNKLAIGINDPNSIIIKIDGSAQAIPANWKLDISSARASINGAIANLSRSVEALKGAQSALALEQQNLSLKKAGPTAEQLRAQEAQVEQAEAAVKNIQAQIAKAVLYAPIDGIVSRIDAKVGEIISSGVPAVSILSSGKFEIETYVSEADIAKISLGNEADVTVDAYGNGVVFEAIVTMIDPAETITKGIPTYKVTLQFSAEDDRIKSGMTANVMIRTKEQSDVLAVPEQAVFTKGNDSFVFLETKNFGSEQREIKVGIKGSRGFIEIISGLNEGDRVINFGSKQE